MHINKGHEDEAACECHLMLLSQPHRSVTRRQADKMSISRKQIILILMYKVLFDICNLLISGVPVWLSFALRDRRGFYKSKCCCSQQL